MKLETAILNAIDLSGRLEAALKVDNLDLCKEILVLRGDAMAAFEHFHKASTPAERKQNHSLILQLVSVDRSLQSQYQAGLETSAVEFRQSLKSGGSVPAGAYNTTASPACVDRKA